MLGSKNIALIFGGELFAGVKSKLQRSIVGLQKHVGSNHFIFQFRMLTLQPRILIAAHIPPGPAVESTVLHMGDVIRNQIVASPIALVHRTPELAGLWIERDSTAGVADTVGVDSHSGPIGIEFENIGAILFA